MKSKHFKYLLSTVNNNYRLRVFFKHLDPSSKFSSGIYSKYYEKKVYI